VHAYSSKVVTTRVDTTIDASQTKATLRTVTTIFNALEGSIVTLSVRDSVGKVIGSQDIELDANRDVEAEWTFAIGKEVELWWPVGQGKQPLYDVVAELKHKVN
jgi:hypothetical protein